MASLKKIIIVDDSPAILDSLQLTFDMEGYQVSVCEKGSELFQSLYTDNIPDMILLDMWLSGEDGRDICKTIKANVNLQHIPIIIMSASRGLAISAMESGADEFISKPFDVFEVVDKVNFYTHRAS